MFRKYQKVEKSSLMSPDEHQEIEQGLHKVGKKALSEATPEERQSILSPAEKLNKNLAPFETPYRDTQFGPTNRPMGNTD